MNTIPTYRLHGAPDTLRHLMPEVVQLPPLEKGQAVNLKNGVKQAVKTKVLVHKGRVVMFQTTQGDLISYAKEGQ